MKRWYNKIGISVVHRTVKNEFGKEASGILIDPYELASDVVTNIKVTNIGALSANVIENG
jgi:hypothetical protein